MPERDPASSSEGAMSLAGDISILAEIIEKFLENWDKMSLAGADPQLLETIREIGGKLGELRPKDPDVTGRCFPVSG